MPFQSVINFLNQPGPLNVHVLVLEFQIPKFKDSTPNCNFCLRFVRKLPMASLLAIFGDNELYKKMFL